MPRFFRQLHKKTGISPGTIEYAGEHKVEKVTVSVFDYDEKHVDEQQVETPEECYPYRDMPGVSWINVNGLHDTDLLKNLGDHFGLHTLVLEDILNTHHRPKIEDHEDYLFVILKMLSYDDDEDRVIAEQVSIILGSTYVLSFQERDGDVFEPVRQRIRTASGRIRTQGPDYLAYALVDAVVDHYLVVLEKLGEQIEDLEESLITEPTPELLQEIYELKREVIFLRKAVWPLREPISGLGRDGSSLIKEGTRVFLGDVHDHIIQTIDVVESYRELITGLQDLYLSSVSNRMNEVMKVLTIIATIFVPLTFIAGVYGMNFEFMPELHWRWAYPAVWVVMVAVAVVMLDYFRRKGWF